MPIPPPIPLFVFRGDVCEVHSLLFHQKSNEHVLYVGKADGTIQIWDLTTNKKKSSFTIGNLPCLSLHFIGSHLVTQDKNCRLRIWNISNDNMFACVYEKNFNNLSFCKIDVLRNELAIPQPNSLVEVREYLSSSTRLVARLQYHDASVKLGEVLQLKLFLHTSNLFVAVVYESGNLTIWDAEKSSMVSSVQITNETPMAFDFDAEKLQGVCGSNEKLIIFFKLDTQLQLTKRKWVEITNAGVGCLRIRPDRRVLAAGCWDGKVRIFSWKTCKLLAALDCHRTSVLDIAFTSMESSRVLAVAASDKKVSLWNIYD